MKKIDEQQLEELLSRGVDEVIDREHLKKKLQSGKKLRIKLGIDPTSPAIHLGRAIPLLKLRDFQDLGHTAVFIVGDYTGIVGDASDKESERPMLTQKEVQENGATYFKQAFKILDKKKTEVHYNSKWLKKLGLLEIAKMANLFGLHEFSAREMIAKRMREGKRVSYLEVMYPLFQGYDSVAVKADVELGGTDQRFNLLTGRKIQEFYGQEAQDIMMNELLEGTDGRKMSSSWGNVINLVDSPADMFGKVMSLKDEFIIKYLMLCTRVSLDEIEKIKALANPRDQKARLAHEIVKMYHGEKAAVEAAGNFDRIFRRHETPEDVAVFETAQKNYPILDLLCDSGLAESKNDAKRVVEGGGVQVQVKGQKSKVKSWREEIVIEDGMVIQFGKRKFVKIRLK